MISDINPNMVVLAREARGLSQQDLAERLNLHKANVSRLEKGDTNIQKETLLAISEATCFPPQFFTQQGISMPANLAYRKRQQVPVRLLTPIEAKMNIVRKHVQFVTRALDKVVPQLPVLEVTESRTPSLIASLVRKQWNLEDQAIENLINFLENQGIIINSFKFETERVDSRSMLTDDKYP